MNWLKPSISCNCAGVLARRSRYDLLAIDEVGYVPLAFIEWLPGRCYCHHPLAAKIRLSQFPEVSPREPGDSLGTTR
jgi:hypothetical protein